MKQQGIVQETKTIYFIRHSKSSHDNPDLKDFDRPLAERGIREAPMMGQRLNKTGIVIDLVISSPSKRTRETVALFARELPFEVEDVLWNKEVYAAPTEILKDVIYNIDDQYSNVLIFGHNPSFTHCVNFFQKDTVIMNLPTSGIFGIEFQTDSWLKTKKIKGKFIFMDYPKKPQN